MRYLLSAVASIAFLASTPAAAEEVIGLVGSTRIVTFDSGSPGTITSDRAITGLGSDVTLTGIDLRPADNQLYSVSTTGTVYRLTLSGSSYTATSLGTFSPSPSGNSFGLDFNPTVDRLRMVSDTNQNLRINQTTSPPGVIVDGPITLNGSSDVDLIGAAYTNSFAGATTTTLYGIDAFTDALVRSTNANLGTYTNTNLAGALFGPLGVSIGSNDLLGFDISGVSGASVFSVNNNFYGVDLTTGSATLIGALGAQGVTGITFGAAVPEPGTWAMMLMGFGAIGVAMRRRRKVIGAVTA
ncbi:MAG: DUF4394 domain-containing protein [Pseudomonadota bacterium]